MVEDRDDNLEDIRKLYPDMTDAELTKARDNLRRYIGIIWRIHQRIKAEGKNWPGLDKYSPKVKSIPPNLLHPTMRRSWK